VPDEQDFNCLLAPEAFRKLPNAWGERGWTVAILSNLSTDELVKALETAWRHACRSGRRRLAAGRDGEAV
jgi:hypothetical protein